MESIYLLFDLVQALLLILISVFVYRQSLEYKRVEELLRKAQQAAEQTETTLDDTAVSLAQSLLQFLSSLRAIHVEVKPEAPSDEEAEG